MFVVLLLGCPPGPVEPPADAGLAEDAGQADAGSANAQALAAILSSRRVLWVGAHPDDEAYVAPLLYDVCVRRGAACTFLVLTDGGKGNCAIAGNPCGTKNAGGAPDGSVGAWRIGEMRASAAWFGAMLEVPLLEDTPSDNVLGAMQNWNQTYSNLPNDTDLTLITQKVADVLLASNADLIVTFDPRHGVYCHPDHRAVAVLALRAAILNGFDLTRVVMFEGAEPYGDGMTIVNRAWVPADARLFEYDAFVVGTWSARADVAALHASQFSPTTVAIYRAFPPQAQRLPLLQAARAITNGRFDPDPAYDAICATEQVWSGRGVCPLPDGGTRACW